MARTRKNKSKVYNKKDFHSGDGMLTTVWGPSLWHYMHTMSFNYPVKPTDENKKYYKNILDSLQNGVNPPSYLHDGMIEHAYERFLCYMVHILRFKIEWV